VKVEGASSNGAKRLTRRVSGEVVISRSSIEREASRIDPARVVHEPKRKTGRTSYLSFLCTSLVGALFPCHAASAAADERAGATSSARSTRDHVRIVEIGPRASERSARLAASTTRAPEASRHPREPRTETALAPVTMATLPSSGTRRAGRAARVGANEEFCPGVQPAEMM